jgi:hypothetical protein
MFRNIEIQEVVLRRSLLEPIRVYSLRDDIAAPKGFGNSAPLLIVWLLGSWDYDTLFLPYEKPICDPIDSYR